MGRSFFGDILLEKLKEAGLDDIIPDKTEEDKADRNVRDKINSFNAVKLNGEPIDDDTFDTRDEDDAAEQRFTKNFLMPVIYPGFIEKGLAVEIANVTERKGQTKGSDAYYKLENGVIIKVDNKNRASVLNKSNHLIPVELYTDNKHGKRIDGWFIDNDKDTDYICSTHCFTGNSKQLKFNKIGMDEITKVDIFMFKLDDLKGYLNSVGYSINKLADEAKDFEKEFIKNTENVINKKDINSQDRQKHIAPGVILYTSIYSVKENPTVILVDENIIKALSNTRHFQWNNKYGLFEVCDKSYRPDLTPSEKNMRHRDRDDMAI